MAQAPITRVFLESGYAPVWRNSNSKNIDFIQFYQGDANNEYDDQMDGLVFYLTGKEFELTEYEDRVNYEYTYTDINPSGLENAHEGVFFMKHRAITVVMGTVIISDPNFGYMCQMTVRASRELKKSLDTYIKSQADKAQARETGRELTAMRNVHQMRNLPLINDTLGVVGSFLTGNEGSLNSQINKQKQKAGISLAPRPRKLRKTRKTRKTRKL